jgi:hypothetical protein
MLSCSRPAGWPVPPAAPTIGDPGHDSLVVSWLENEMGQFDAPITKYVVCWKEVTEGGADVGKWCRVSPIPIPSLENPTGNDSECLFFLTTLAVALDRPYPRSFRVLFHMRQFLTLLCCFVRARCECRGV